MHDDVNLAVMNATFKIEQAQDKGNVIAGTSWLVRVSGEGEDAKIALITAFHVLDLMKKSEASVIFRRLDENGKWYREPQSIKIRDDNGQGLWLKHPERDIAAIWINPPEQARNNAISFNALADEKSLRKYDISLGDELLALGYPKGLAANGYGFPILRSGKVASYPIAPIRDFPTFLMDFSVFAGNSGGPVYMTKSLEKKAKKEEFGETHFIIGLIAQQVNLDDERLEIGIVLHASFVRDLLLELLEDDHEWNIV